MSQDELEKIKASDLIGTKFLQSYMHGFIMKAKLYNKLKEKAQPFDYHAYKEEQVQTRIDKEMKRDKIVNKNLKTKANEKLIELAARNTANQGRETLSAKARQSVLADERFKGLTQDVDYERDETNEDFLLRNPSAAARLKKKTTGR